MPAIRSLKLHKPFQFHVPYDVQNEIFACDLTAALPCLVQLSVCIAASREGVALANAFVNFRGLQELDISLLGPASAPPVLKLLTSSSLVLLRLQAHPDVQVSLELQRDNLECELCGVTTVRMPRPFRGLSKMHVG